MRTQGLTEVESRCFRCEPLRGSRGQAARTDHCPMRLDPRRLFAESGRHQDAVQLTARTEVAGDSSSWSQFRADPITAALASFNRGISSRMSSRISVASGHSGPEHSTSTWRRSSSASGHRIRLTTRPPSTRKTMCPRKDTRRAWTDVAPYPSSGGRIGLEKTSERSTALPRVDVQRPAGTSPDHRPRAGVRRSRFGWPGAAHRTEARPAGTAFCRCAGTPRARPRRWNEANRLRTGGRTPVGVPRAGSRGSTDLDPFRGRTRAPAPAHGWTLPGRERDQVAVGQVRQLRAGLGVGRVKLAGHQEIVGRPALRCSAKFGDNAAGDRPFAAETRREPLPAQRDRCESLRRPRLATRRPRRRCSRCRRQSLSGASRSKVAAALSARSSRPRRMAFCKALIATQGETSIG